MLADESRSSPLSPLALDADASDKSDRPPQAERRAAARDEKDHSAGAHLSARRQQLLLHLFEPCRAVWVMA